MMSCCGGDIAAESVATTSQEIVRKSHGEELARQAVKQADGTSHFILTCPDIHCGACIGKIERGLLKLDGVIEVRVNLTLKRVGLVVDETIVSILESVDELARLGYRSTPLEMDEIDHSKQASRQLLKALAVAGFAAMNVMLLSVSTWSGADGATRDLFHLISALIAVPTVIYSGRIFFSSALGALKHRHLNMDVPISLAIILATGMSLYETFNHGREAYFDAAVSLLFFLLIGRYLDQLMRERARNAVIGLARLSVKGATVITEDNSSVYLPIDEIEPEMRLRIVPGQRIPVDGIIETGKSDLDLSLVTGENAPVTLGAGSEVCAGTYNLTGVIEIKALRAANKSFLAEVSQMLSAAERGRGNYVQIADRMAQIYAPAVHLLAAMAFVYWVLIGGDWHGALYIAISVLIITCPCALGLAVPVVHVVAAARLFEEGILVKDGSALERMAETDHAVFDKTGTLTNPLPEVIETGFKSKADKQLALSLALLSSHPASRALAKHLEGNEPLVITNIKEIAGSGVEASYGGHLIRLGKGEWVSEICLKQHPKGEATSGSQTGFAKENGSFIAIKIHETLRANAHEMVEGLSEKGIGIEILSGDRPEPVSKIGNKLGIDHWMAAQRPQDKIAHIEELKKSGKHPVMIGDGLNDAPCLAAGHASMAPASASDIGRAAADFVFTRQGLEAVSFAHGISQKARTLVKQNFGLAIVYNLVAVPLAFGGYVTPLFAAIAMSLSSIVVVMNSMRLTRYGKFFLKKESKTSLSTARLKEQAV